MDAEQVTDPFELVTAAADDDGDLDGDDDGDLDGDDDRDGDIEVAS